MLPLIKVHLKKAANSLHKVTDSKTNRLVTFRHKLLAYHVE